MALRLLFAGGGTGGHLIPALVVAEAVKRCRPDAVIRFVATDRPIEARLLPASGFSYDTIPVLSLKRELHPDLIRFPFVNTAGFLRSIRLVAGFRPHLFFSTGGYLAGPVGVAAALMGVPIVLAEPNVFPGITVRLLSRAATQVHLNYPEAARRVGGRQKPCSGIPLKALQSGQVGLDRAGARKQFGLAPDRSTLLITGGSQGALGINRAVAAALPALVEAGVQILWQAGRLGIDAATEAAAQWPEAVKAIEFIDDMPAAYSASDLAVTRAGASTLAEQALYGVPAILVPLPTASENHQEFNARSVERRGAAVTVLQRDLTGPGLAKTVTALVGDTNRLDEMKRRALEASDPNAAERIVSSMIERGLLKGRRG